MEEIDPVDDRLGELDVQAEAEDATIATAQAALAATEAGLESDLARAGERRNAADVEVPGEVLGRYEGLRGIFGASTVVRFDGANCRGCPSSMPAVEVDRVKHLEGGTLTECTECGRLVAR